MIEESADGCYFIGFTDYETRRVTYLAIQAAKLTCCGVLGNEEALKFLKLATRELEHVLKSR
jgi:hypothetical protein